ncbi:ABC transporter ATP-binding protein [Desulfovibrio inopinatus]|uniref:ABC transporter ATP-binding protein n=1 Tax=Desulfovibrio inopinatus TaxID=102109 RepID=UPI00041D4A3B|nr:ATP-binding cassette domain-containing protein [Desulfovibrio inopinatus]
MSTPLLEIRGLTKSFQGQTVLRDVSFSVCEGTITALIGKSGEGKSVLLKHIVKLMRPDAGEILYKGRNIATMKGQELSLFRKKCSFMFQGMALFDSMTVFENIALPLRERTKMSSTSIAHRVDQVMKELELGAVGAKYPSQISGGMQKRVALARALITEPEIVLFDEPTTGLDPIRKASVYRLILESRRRFSFTAIVVSHDIPDVFSVCEDIVMLDGGRIVYTGSSTDIVHDSNPTIQLFINSHGPLRESDLELATI